MMPSEEIIKPQEREVIVRNPSCFSLFKHVLDVVGLWLVVDDGEIPACCEARRVGLVPGPRLPVHEIAGTVETHLPC